MMSAAKLQMLGTIARYGTYLAPDEAETPEAVEVLNTLIWDESVERVDGDNYHVTPKGSALYAQLAGVELPAAPADEIAVLKARVAALEGEKSAAVEMYTAVLRNIADMADEAIKSITVQDYANNSLAVPMEAVLHRIHQRALATALEILLSRTKEE